MRLSGWDGSCPLLLTHNPAPTSSHPCFCLAAFSNCSIAVTVSTPAGLASCEPAQFLAALHPTASLSPSGPGFLVGPINTSVDASGGFVYTQAVGALMRQPPVQAVQASASSGTLPLPGSLSFHVTP